MLPATTNRPSSPGACDRRSGESERHAEAQIAIAFTLDSPVAGSCTAVGRMVVPSSAPHDPPTRFPCLALRIDTPCLTVKVCRVLIETPLLDIAVAVEQAPRVRRKSPDFDGLLAPLADLPKVPVHVAIEMHSAFVWNFTVVELPSRPRTTGVFPHRLGWQSNLATNKCHHPRAKAGRVSQSHHFHRRVVALENCLALCPSLPATVPASRGKSP